MKRTSLPLLCLFVLAGPVGWLRGADTPGEVLLKETETAIATLQPPVASANQRWHDSFVGQVKLRSGQPMPEPEVMAEVRRATQTLADATRRITTLAGDLQRQRIDYARLGDETDALFTEAVITSWDMHLSEARRTLALAQTRIDGETRRIRQQWTQTVTEITRRGGDANERPQLLATAAAPVREDERHLLDSSGETLDKVAYRVALARQSLRELVTARVEAARRAGRTAAAMRLNNLVATQLESVGPGPGANGDASSLDTFLASAQLDCPTIVLRDNLPNLKLAERIKPLLATTLVLEIPNEHAGQYPVYPVEPDQMILRVERFDPGRTPERNWRELLGRDLAEGWGADDRLLVVYGLGLFAHGRPPRLLATDLKATYTLLDVTPEDHRAPYTRRYDGLWPQVISTTLAGLNGRDLKAIPAADAALVRVTFRPGVAGGLKRFKLDGLPVEWLEPAGNVTARLDFVRPVGGDNEDAVQTVYRYDRFRVRARVNAPCDLEELECVVFKGQEPWKVEGEPAVTLHRSATDPTLYESKIIRLVTRAGELRRENDVADEVVEPGATLVALLPRAGAVRMEQPAGTRVEESPEAIGALWDFWLQEAERLSGKKARPDQRRDAVPVETISYRHLTHGNVEIPLQMGDYAAMLMLRQAYVRSLTPMREEMKQLQARAATDPKALQEFTYLAMPAMGDPNDPIAKLDVPDPVESLVQGSVPFSRVFDETYLRNSFTSDNARRQWQLKATRAALDTYVAAMDHALQAAQDVDDRDLLKLLELTGTGFDPVARALRPNMLRRRTGADSPGWEPDPFAISRLYGIKTIADENFANRALTKAEQEVVVAAAGAVFFAPSTVFYRGVGLAVSAGFVAKSAFVDIPEYFAGRRDLQFALGSYAILGPARMAIAEARATSGIGVTLSLVGSTMTMGGEFLNFLTALQEGAHLAKLPSVLSDLETNGVAALVAMSTEDKAAYATVLARARLAQLQRVGTLGELESRVLNVDRMLAARLRVFEKIRLASGEVILESTLAERAAVEEAALGEPPPPAPEPIENPTMATNAVLDLPGTGAPEVPRNFPGPEGGAFTLPGGKVVQLGRRLGVGAHSVVYEYLSEPGLVCDWLPKGTQLRPGTRLVIKLTKGDRATAKLLVENQRATSQLLDESNITNLRLVGGNENATIPYIVQERLPEGAVTYGYQGARRPSTDWGLVETEQDLYAYISGGPLPPEHQRAFMTLWRKIADKNVIWEDGHLGNIYFTKEGDTWVAGVLDHERFLRWTDNVANDRSLATAIPLIEGMPTVGFNGRNPRIYSMEHAPTPDNYDDIVAAGRHLYPDPRFFMAKMLEYNGRYIRYNRVTNQWLGKHLDLDIVREFFPEFESYTSLTPPPPPPPVR